jgi:hypothetical protein
MASWNVTINQHIDEAASENRAKQVYCLLQNTLYTNWTLIAYSDGSTTFTKNAAGITPNPYPTFPAITGGTVDINNDSWVVFENADGVQVVLQVHNDYVYLFSSVDTSYLDSPGPWDDATNTVRPGYTTTPTDELSPYGASTYYGSPFYISLAMSTDNNSFIMFSGIGLQWCLVFVKVEDTKTGDDHPYWAYNRVGSSTFKDAYLSSNTAEHAAGIHPVGNQQCYILSRPYGYADCMDTMTADPYTGNEQLIEPLCICEKASYKHIRGKVPGFWRNSSLRGAGDTFDGGTYMCLGEWSVPWNGTLTALI